jgi:hypothetical protein
LVGFGWERDREHFGIPKTDEAFLSGWDQERSLLSLSAENESLLFPPSLSLLRRLFAIATLSYLPAPDPKSFYHPSNRPRPIFNLSLFCRLFLITPSLEYLNIHPALEPNRSELILIREGGNSSSLHFYFVREESSHSKSLP